MSDDRWKRGVPPKVLVIGGSMAGLFAALLLRREGWDVDDYERIGAELAGRGAGIVTHSELFDVLARAVAQHTNLLKNDFSSFLAMLSQMTEGEGSRTQRNRPKRSENRPGGGRWPPNLPIILPSRAGHSA